MKKLTSIWNHEINVENKIARNLVETKKVKFGWRILIPPFFLLDYFRYKKSLILTRKNLLFTKQLSFDAAKEIFQGKDRSFEIRSIEIKTKNILDKDRKGFYTEKIRRKQFHEIDLLITHYLGLLNSRKSKYDEMIKTFYKTKGKYLSFLNTLQKAEQEVIQASITTIKKGSKKNRIQWFKKVEETSKKAMMDEVERIFSNG